MRLASSSGSRLPRRPGRSCTGVSDGEANDGSYTWIVPNIQTETARIRVDCAMSIPIFFSSSFDLAEGTCVLAKLLPAGDLIFLRSAIWVRVPPLPSSLAQRSLEEGGSRSRDGGRTDRPTTVGSERADWPALVHVGRAVRRRVCDAERYLLPSRTIPRRQRSHSGRRGAPRSPRALTKTNRSVTVSPCTT